MSTAMVSMVLDCFPSGGSMCLLAVAMADAADDEGGNIFKSVATLAHQSKQSERTVQRALPMLVDGGWLELVSDGSGGRGRPRVYRIAPAWITRCAMERARARVEGRKPQRVTLGPAADGGGDGAGAHPPALPGPPGVVAGVAVDAGYAQKGVNLSPFMEWQKGDKNSVKGDKNGLKGDSHGCHPNMNIEPNTPLPPVGVGEVLQNPEQPTAPDACGQGPGGPQAGVERCGAPLSVPGVAPKPGPSASPDGLALLLAAYPRQDVADATAASRAYTRLAPSAEDVRTMLAAMGCPAEIAEAILGHQQPGIVATYNRHAYDAERRHWLTLLSAHLELVAAPAQAPQRSPAGSRQTAAARATTSPSSLR